MPDTPMFQDTLQYTGQNMRDNNMLHVMAEGTVFSARSGVRPGDPGLAVTLAGSTISVSAGIAAVHGSGLYTAVLTSAWSGTLQAANATQPRIDLVYLRVWDTDADGSGLRKTDVVYLPGTASATPSAPTPAGTQIYLPLATITVPASGGGAASVSTAVRPTTVAPGGILPAASAPAGPYTGQYYDDGTGLRRYDGAAWDYVKPVGIGQAQYVRKTADTVRTNNAIAADDPHLTLPVAANAVYVVDVYVIYSTGTVGNFNISFGPPSGSTLNWAPWGMDWGGAAVNGPDSDIIRVPNTTGTANRSLGGGTDNTVNVTARPKGLLRTTSAGSISFRWSQFTSDSVATTVYTESFMTLLRVA